jgi:hypothetical protein
MNDDAPFPPALPAVVPSPIGPAISYSNIRAVTSRAQSLLDQLERKIKKKIQNGLSDAGMVGARIETKIRDGIQQRLAPHEQLFNEIDDFIHNQIAGNLAPAVATLEDLQGQLGESQRVTPTTGTAGDGSAVAAPEPLQPLKPLTQAPSTRAVGLARQLQRATAQVVGGPPINPFVQPCANPPDAAITAAQNAMVAYSVAHPNPPLPIAFHYYLDPNCCVFTLGEGQEASPLKKCSIDLGIVTMTAADAPVVLALIVDTLRKNGVAAATGDCTASCAPIGGVDCTKTPLDPACPPDCKTHPEDPRCPPTPPTCPPPCIEVTCPPPNIIVEPCKPLEPTSCIQIDLCDWDKFCSFIKKCFVESKKDCALDNDVAYALADCDGQLGQAQQFYWDNTADTLNGAATVSDAVRPTGLQQAQIVAVSACGRDLLQDCVPV